MLAQEATLRLSLQRVVLMPYGDAPHKQIEQDPGREARLEMTRLAADGDDRFVVSSLEVERDGPSYTHETLEAVAAQRPGTELVLVIGADAAAGLGGWRRPERVLELASLGVASRPGAGEADARAALERAGGAGRMAAFAIPDIEVSSTLVRQRVQAGEPIRYLVPDAVASYIERQGLYSG